MACPENGMGTACYVWIRLYCSRQLRFVIHLESAVWRCCSWHLVLTTQIHMLLFSFLDYGGVKDTPIKPEYYHSYSNTTISVSISVRLFYRNTAMHASRVFQNETNKSLPPLLTPKWRTSKQRWGPRGCPVTPRNMQWNRLMIRLQNADINFGKDLSQLRSLLRASLWQNKPNWRYK
jgi:hypothetical protein